MHFACLLAIQATGAVRLTYRGDDSQHRAIYGRKSHNNPHDDFNVINWVLPITRKEQAGVSQMGISPGLPIQQVKGIQKVAVDEGPEVYRMTVKRRC